LTGSTGFQNMLNPQRQPIVEYSNAEAALLFPGLAPFYNGISDLWYPMIRITIGSILLVHGWGKLNAGLTGEVAYFAKAGFEPANLFAGAAILLESVGALCVAIGLFTRFFAAALAIELGVMFLFVHLPKGFGLSKGGYEYVLLMGVVMFAIALRGGGPYSIDRIIGKEL
jgi:putative oxidoreductase